MEDLIFISVISSPNEFNAFTITIPTVCFRGVFKLILEFTYVQMFKNSQENFKKNNTSIKMYCAPCFLDIVLDAGDKAIIKNHNLVLWQNIA